MSYQAYTPHEIPCHFKYANTLNYVVFKMDFFFTTLYVLFCLFSSANQTSLVLYLELFVIIIIDLSTARPPVLVFMIYASLA